MQPESRDFLRLTVIAVASIWLGLFVFTLLRGVSGVLTVNDYEFRLWGPVIGTTWYGWAPWIVLVPLTLWLARRYPVRPQNWLRSICVHAGLMCAVALIHGYMAAQAYYYSDDVTPEMEPYAPWQHTGHFLFMDDMFLFDALIYFCLIASRNISNFYSLAQQRELDAARMHSQLAESRLQALLMQVNPHFLFNTLNAIAVLVRKQESNKATTMIEKLASFFRYTLETRVEQWVPLSRELDIIDQYLDIEKVRIGPRLTVRKSISEAAMSFPIPMLITQPLVENAIRHGVGGRDGECEVVVDARVVGTALMLSISDTGAGCDFDATSTSTGIGIANVRERLAQSYGDGARLQLRGAIGTGVDVTLELPDIRGLEQAEQHACA